MDTARELAVLTKMADELKDYLLSDVLFWQMQAGSDFPKLSLGRLLLARYRLRAVDERLTPEQRAQAQHTEQRLAHVLGQWQVAAERHAARELHARANLWQRFWEECAEHPAACADNYAQEVTQRAIAGLLLREFPRVAETPEARALAALDETVRPRLRRDGFVWDEPLRPGFPEADFWFLYGHPAGQPAAAR
jgi:hypothetical protein